MPRCAHCRTPLPPPASTRPARWCSPTCRTRTWSATEGDPTHGEYRYVTPSSAGHCPTHPGCVRMRHRALRPVPVRQPRSPPGQRGQPAASAHPPAATPNTDGPRGRRTARRPPVHPPQDRQTRHQLHTATLNRKLRTQWIVPCTRRPETIAVIVHRTAWRRSCTCAWPRSAPRCRLLAVAAAGRGRSSTARTAQASPATVVAEESRCLSADFHATGSTQGSDELVAEGPVVPPGHWGGGWEFGLA